MDCSYLICNHHSGAQSLLLEALSVLSLDKAGFNEVYLMAHGQVGSGQEPGGPSL